MRKQHVKCGPTADRFSRISIKMASEPCGGTIANTVRVFTATLPATAIHLPSVIIESKLWYVLNRLLLLIM